MIKIDSDAPVVSRDSIRIQAPVETVWTLLTDINSWPEWQPNVSYARLHGELAAGSDFQWKASGLSMKSTLEVVDAPRHVGWTGDSIGMHAIHIWHLEPDRNQTVVHVEESLSGWLARFLSATNREFLKQSMARSLQVLKQQSEELA